MKYRISIFFLFIFLNASFLLSENIHYFDYSISFTTPLNKGFSNGGGLGGSSGIKFKGRFYPEFGFSFSGYNRNLPNGRETQGIFMYTNFGLRIYISRWKGLENYFHTIIGFNNAFQLFDEHSGVDFCMGGRHLGLGIGSDYPIGKTWLCGLELSYLKNWCSNAPLDFETGEIFIIYLHFINRYKKCEVKKEEIF